MFFLLAAVVDAQKYGEEREKRGAIEKYAIISPRKLLYVHMFNSCSVQPFSNCDISGKCVFLDFPMFQYCTTHSYSFRMPLAWELVE